MCAQISKEYLLNNTILSKCTTNIPQQSNLIRMNFLFFNVDYCNKLLKYILMQFI